MKYISLIILAVVILSCSTTKKSTKNNKADNSSSIEYKFDLSLQTKLFLQEFENEKLEKSTDSFVPSQNLIDKYNIKIVEDLHTISGFIKVNSDYNEEELNRINIKTGSQSNNIITVIIPMGSIDKFLILNGVEYFEIGQKVELKNN